MIRSAKKTVLALLLLVIPAVSLAEGLSVEKYLEDPEHTDELIVFYLSSVFTGIKLVNDRIKPPLFCMSDNNSDSAFEMIDKRISKLQKEKKITGNTTVDSLMMDVLIDEFPCR